MEEETVVATTFDAAREKESRAAAYREADGALAAQMDAIQAQRDRLRHEYQQDMVEILMAEPIAHMLHVLQSAPLYAHRSSYLDAGQEKLQELVFTSNNPFVENVCAAMQNEDGPLRQAIQPETFAESGRAYLQSLHAEIRATGTLSAFQA